MTGALDPAVTMVAPKNRWVAWADGLGHWIASLAFNLCLPLAPLVVEFAVTKTVSDSNLALAASMYSVTTGVASRSTFLFALSILVSFFYTALFGFLVSGQALDGGSFAAIWVIAFLLASNAMLKFKHHVVDLKPYTEFSLRAPS